MYPDSADQDDERGRANANKRIVSDLHAATNPDTFRSRIQTQVEANRFRFNTDNMQSLREHMDAWVTDIEATEKRTGKPAFKGEIEAYSEQFQAWHAEARGERTWDEVIKSSLESDKQTLGDDYPSFEAYFTGYVTAINDWAKELKQPNEENAAVKVHESAMQAWADHYKNH